MGLPIAQLGGTRTGLPGHNDPPLMEVPVRQLSIALAAVVVLTACDNAGPTSPSTTRPSTPNAPDAAPILNLPLFGGQSSGPSTHAVALSANALGLVIKSAEAGPFGLEGGSESVSALTATLPNILSTGVLNGDVWANRYHSRASSSVDQLWLNLVGLKLTASVLAAKTAADCEGDVVGSSSVASITINGKTIAITGQPNQTIPLLVGKVVINEKQPYNNGIRVRALHVVVNGIADVVVAEAASPRLGC